MRRIVLLALILSLVSLQAHESSAAPAPASVSLSVGYSNELGPRGNNFTPVPAVSALWPLTSNVSVFSKVSYLQQRYLDDPLRVASSTGYDPFRPAQPATVRNHFLPLGAGIRLSAENTTRTRGVFVEIGPAAFLASMDVGPEGRKQRMLAGLQAGAGIRFLAIGRSHGEVGMSLYRSEKANAPEDAWYESTTHRDVDAYVLYAGFGLSR